LYFRFAAIAAIPGLQSVHQLAPSFRYSLHPMWNQKQRQEQRNGNEIFSMGRGIARPLCSDGKKKDREGTVPLPQLAVLFMELDVNQRLA
jgi:hypothetical protein